MTVALREAPDLDAGTGSRIVARRAVFRWGWRLFRRGWRQQLLVLSLLTVAVAATIWGAGVVTNAQLPNARIRKSIASGRFFGGLSHAPITRNAAMKATTPASTIAS